PRRMAERVRSGRVEGAVPQLTLVRAVLCHRRRALNRERGDDERRQEGRRLVPQMQDCRVLALGGAAPVETRRQVTAVVVLEAKEDGLPVVRRRGILERSPEVVLAIEVRAGRRCVERRAVRELDSVPEVERPVLPVRGTPTSGQSWPDQGRA